MPEAAAAVDGVAQRMADDNAAASNTQMPSGNHFFSDTITGDHCDIIFLLHMLEEVCQAARKNFSSSARVDLGSSSRRRCPQSSARPLTRTALSRQVLAQFLERHVRLLS